MNNNPLQQNSFKVLYFHYRNTVYYPVTIVLIVLIVSFILVIEVIIPQYQQWSVIQQEVNTEQTKLNTVNQNIAIISKIDKDQLNKQLQVATAALPDGKDFTAVMSAVSNAALNAGVVLEDYSFRVGHVATGSATADVVTSQYQLPSLRLTLIIDGSLDGTKKYVDSLQKLFPLSAINTLDGTSTTSEILVEFFNKPFTHSAFNGEDPLTPLTQQESNLINDLTSWQATGSAQPGIAAPIASSSAIPVF